ncbi:hypothetical protein TcBrA4_0096780 [Trypanosoma cruzi]|nr:hypothetical protein TcBrA4_0096780 [Trypanosoma cruzi]
MANDWAEEEDVADQEEMARRAMEELVATTEKWLLSREATTRCGGSPRVAMGELAPQRGGGQHGRKHAALASLWSTQLQGPETGSRQLCANESSVTGEVSGVFSRLASQLDGWPCRDCVATTPMPLTRRRMTERPMLHAAASGWRKNLRRCWMPLRL